MNYANAFHGNMDVNGRFWVVLGKWLGVRGVQVMRRVNMHNGYQQGG